VLSNESFSDFRDWLVSRGRDIYERDLADPDNLADVSDARPEEMYASPVGGAGALSISPDPSSDDAAASRPPPAAQLDEFVDVDSLNRQRFSQASGVAVSPEGRL
jgi:Protein of unknown function (DUF4240)